MNLIKATRLLLSNVDSDLAPVQWGTTTNSELGILLYWREAVLFNRGSVGSIQRAMGTTFLENW